MEPEKELKTKRLRKLEEKLSFILKSKCYVENEIKKIREKEKETREKISKEKKAIYLVNRAKKLR
jgi:predicted  nucleic acid-binding Zn-ribbon protein